MKHFAFVTLMIVILGGYVPAAELIDLVQKNDG